MWREVNERYWELEMGQFNGFEEFNFFRAINPGFHTGMDDKKPGIVVGDQETFQRYKDLYDCKYHKFNRASRLKNYFPSPDTN